jgi:hypothetical protein
MFELGAGSHDRAIDVRKQLMERAEHRQDTQAIVTGCAALSTSYLHMGQPSLALNQSMLICMFD